jgi:hypothetical protein
MTHIMKMAVAAAMLAGIGTAAPAFAADNAMKVCGAKYQAAKTAKTLPAGQTWNQYLAQCRASLPKPAAVTTPAKPVVASAVKPAVAAKPAPTRVAVAKPPKTPGQPSPAQAAMYARERQCGAQYRADKAAGKLPAGQTWPQYWSACNKRMK